MFHRAIPFVLLAVCVSLVTLDTLGQEPRKQTTPEAIRLKARVFVPKAGVDPELEAAFRNASTKRVHVIMQFVSIPDVAARRRLLDTHGVRVLDTVPERAFFASMAADTAVAKRLLEGQLGIHWIGPIQPNDRLSHDLRHWNIPRHAQRGRDRAELSVLFFGDVDPESQKSSLEELGARVLGRIGAINGWMIELSEARIDELAGLDAVKWVEPAPPEAEEDNDGVRSATGVNADAVLAPTPWAISGAGVTIAQWESSNASLTHGDFVGRIVLGDAPIPLRRRSDAHAENVTANGQYDLGENVYVDMDDSATVTANDVRATAVGGFGAGSMVAAVDGDVGTALILFGGNERFVDGNGDGTYTAGEALYRDNDGNPFSTGSTLTAGDQRINASGGFPAGSIVAVGDADVGTLIRALPTNPHAHATHVAGTAMGSGAQSLANGGSANQWMGVAAAATLRSYRVDGSNPASFFAAVDYPNASAAGVNLSTNSWGFSHHHQQPSVAAAYDTFTSFYDAVVSGRQSDGTASGLNRFPVLGSSGNRGRPERFVDSVTADGTWTVGEPILLDNDDSGTVSVGDSVRLGPTPAIGPALVDFPLNVRHNDNGNGLYNTTEAIYLDADSSLAVSAGDTRLTAAAGFAAGSVVAGGDADVGTFLRQFRQWGNVRLPNSAKDTIVVANLRSDTKVPSPSSSRGPTADGRVKPDVSGPGSQAAGDLGVTSTVPLNAYDSFTGTSMSTPAVAGVSALLIEWYRQASLAAGPTPDVVRALLIHSAEDLQTIPNVPGLFAGPDFTHGYGRVDAQAAMALVPHHRVGTMTGPTVDYTVTVGAMAPLKVTLAWDDPAWTAAAAPSAATGVLQNDLDLLLIAPDGTQFTPWVLAPSNPWAPATRSSIAAGTIVPATARDGLNTVEQVEVANAMAGTWTIRVSGPTLNLPPQPYVIVSEAIPPQDSPTAGLPASDVWMRDNLADTGTVPSTGTLWLSPDLFNRIALDTGTTHQNPEFGQTNYLYANVRNRSTTTVAAATTLEFWIGQASVGLTWPDNFTRVGSLAVPNLGIGESRQVGPLAWSPPSPSPSDHFCFYLRLVSTQDPITIAETGSVGNNARNSNNIAWRNINIVDLLSSRSVTFLVRNLERKRAPIDLLLNVPDEFLKAGRVDIALEHRLETRWRAGGGKAEGIERDRRPFYHPWPGSPPTAANEVPEPKPYPLRRHRVLAPRASLRGILLDPGETGAVTLTFGSEMKDRATYDVHVVQEAHGKVVGGILYQVRTGRASNRDE